MTNELRSARDKLDRAKEHIEEFQRRARGFIQSQPYRRIVQNDPATGEQVTKIRVVKQMPKGISNVTADAVGNLRAALDQAGYAAAIAAGGVGKETYFPFGETETEVLSRATGASKEIPAAIFAAMVFFKPYRGGNTPLWALNQLCNSDKHRLTFATVSASGGMSFNASGSGGFRIGGPVWNREKNEIEILRCNQGATLDYNIKLSIYIAFGEIDAVENQPVEPFLLHMAAQVAGILVAIEAEGKRTGLFK